MTDLRTHTTGLREWLQYLRLDKYYEPLSSAGHDAQSLAQLSDAELVLLGLPLGPRKKILLNAGLIRQTCRCVSGSQSRDDVEGQDRQSGKPVVSKISGSFSTPSPSTVVAATGSLQTAADLVAVRVLQPLQAPQNYSDQLGSASPKRAWLGGQHIAQPRLQSCSRRPLSSSPPQGSCQDSAEASTSAHQPQFSHAHALQPSSPPVSLVQFDTHPTPAASLHTTVQPSHPPTHGIIGLPVASHWQRQTALSGCSLTSGRAVHQKQQPPPLAPPSHVGTSEPAVIDRPGVDRGASGPRFAPTRSMASVLRAEGVPSLQQQQERKSSRSQGAALPPHMPPSVVTASPREAEPGKAAASSTPAISGRASAASLSAEGRPLTGTAAIERGVLMQLYPAVDRLRHAAAPSGRAVLADIPIPPSTTPNGLHGTGFRGTGCTSAESVLDGTRRRVLKRSRSWNGCGVHVLLPLEAQSQSPQEGQDQLTDGGGQRRLVRWADGQPLYMAAASALPVDCSFRSVRSAAAAAAAAKEANIGGPYIAAGTVPQATLSTARQTSGVLASRTAAIRTSDVVRVGFEKKAKGVLDDNKALKAPPGTAGTSIPRGAYDSGAPMPAGFTAQHVTGNGGPDGVAAVGQGSGASLLDDPRNYGTPELLAQLLYDDPACGVPVTADVTGIGAERDQLAAPGPQRDEDAALHQSMKIVAGDADDHEGSEEGGGVPVSRELRLARLRALREEAAATERLLETLRRMVADEEASLASTAAGGGASNSHGRGPGPPRLIALTGQAQPGAEPQIRGCRTNSFNPAGLRERGAVAAVAVADRPVLAEATLLSGGSPSRERSPAPDPDDIPTQRWDSGITLAEHLDLQS